jgi:putative permease
MKRLAWFVGVSLATLTVVFLLWEFRGALILFLLSLVAAATVRPLTERLSRVGLSPGWALILIYLAGLGLLVIIGYLLGPVLLAELQQLGNRLSLTYERIKLEWPEGNSVQQLAAEQLPPSTELFETLTGEQGVYAARAIFGATANVFGAVAQALIVLVLSIYWGISRTRFERLWLSLLPAEQRVAARDIWRDIETEVGAYLRSELVQSLVAGLLLGVGYWWLGLNYPALLGLVGAIAWLVPMVGGLLAVIPAVLVGLAGGAELALMAALYTFAVFFVLEVAVEPRFFNRRRYSSLLLVLMMALLANELGLLGLILAPPLAVAIQLFFVNYIRLSIPVKAQPLPQVLELQVQLSGVRAMIEGMPEPPPPGTGSMLERLERLIRQSSQVLTSEPGPAKPGSISSFTPSRQPMKVE